MKTRGKLRITITLEMDTGDDWARVWPGCKTLQDAAKLQQKFIDDGDCDLCDFFGGFMDNEVKDVKVEPIGGES